MLLVPPSPFMQVNIPEVCKLFSLLNCYLFYYTIISSAFVPLSLPLGQSCSKSEYVRCLHFSREDSLYVATNNGFLYHASVINNKAVKWTELVHVNEEAPIICMDLLSNISNPSGGFEDWVAVGDGKGSMTIVVVVGAVGNPEVEFTLTWPAEKERHLLGTYWCKSLENRY